MKKSPSTRPGSLILALLIGVTSSTLFLIYLLWSLSIIWTSPDTFLFHSTRPKKRRRVDPAPPNSFTHVVEKGLVSDDEARALYSVFFSGCHLFIPLFDPAYDTYEGLKERSPLCFNTILAVAAKIRAGGGSLGVTFYQCLGEAQAIARNTLFGPTVRKESVQGIMICASCLLC